MRAHGSVSALLAQPLVLALSSSPSGMEAFFRSADLTPELLGNQDARITPSQFAAMWAEAIRSSGNPRLALDIAASLPAGAFGLVEYVCRATSTLGDALSLGLRYLNILNDAVKVGFIADGDSVCVRVLAESEPTAPANHELCFAFLASRAREITSPDVMPLFVEFTHRVSDPSPYEQWFGVPVRFGAAHTQMVYARKILDHKLVTADPSLLAILQRVAEDVSSRSVARPPLTAQVRHELTTGLRSDEASIERIAQKLGLTPRSLQRRLKEEGTSFLSLREELRRELSQRYLDQGLAIAEISFMLGFSEPSAFFRAFKRWTGRTPDESRLRVTR
jgi:AraC-like DNA-binding protein